MTSVSSSELTSLSAFVPKMLSTDFDRGSCLLASPARMMAERIYGRRWEEHS
jgi:hypothetical protein